MFKIKSFPGILFYSLIPQFDMQHDHETSLSSPIKIFLLTVPRRCFFCGSFLLFMICVCHAFLSFHFSLVVTCWERADLLACLYEVLLCFVTFLCGVLGQVWYLNVFIPDLCLLTLKN